ncbi:MAG: hypothetical protein IJC50_04250 [Clostridia bacterium]|nr:hypothetical protein [Clostridia bacterium]
MQSERLFTTDFDGSGVIHYRTLATPDRQGIAWSMAIIKLQNDSEIESGFLYDVARDAQTANRMAELFCRNAVTPCTAQEVMEDMLAQT